MAKYSINDLKEKYAEFSSPCYAVKINDKEIDQQYCKGGLTIELSAKYEASGCSFTISNAFLKDSDTKLKIADDLKKLIKLGNKVEAYAGYRTGGVVSVFTGYIDSIDLDYDKDDGILYIIECLDAKGIMMNSFRSETKVSMKKYSEAVENIVKKYSSLVKINSMNLDKSDGELTTLIEQHNESDYDFIVRLAKKIDYCFFIEKGSLLFKPFSKLSKENFFQFDINYYMLEFKMTSSLKNQVSSVTVRANNEKDPTSPFEAKANSPKSLANGSNINKKAASIITNDVSQTVIDLTTDSMERAKKLAQARLNLLSYHLYSGSVKTMGIPELLPGYIAEVIGFGDAFDKKYFISKVIHKIKDDKFTTECKLEGN